MTEKETMLKKPAVQPKTTELNGTELNLNSWYSGLYLLDIQNDEKGNSATCTHTKQPRCKLSRPNMPYSYTTLGLRRLCLTK